MPKVKITKTPGSQSNYSLVGRNSFFPTTGTTGPNEDVKHTISETDPANANAEVEGGETIVGDINNDGFIEHLEATGKRHTEGGVKIHLPEGSFVYSDTKKLKIKDRDVLKNLFNTSYKSGGKTPAEISKNYRLNDYMNILKDKNADALSKRTANEMIQNNLKKLGELALIQESMKGFPNGIPEISESIAAGMGLLPSQEEMKFGGFFRDGGFIRKYQVGGGGPGKGGSTSTKYDPAINMYDPKTQDLLTRRKIELNGIDPSFNQDYRQAQVPGMQYTRPSKVYGDAEYHQGTHYEDFKRRHAAFLQQNPNFDPTKTEDVGKFQNYYNQYIQDEGDKAGLTPEEINQMVNNFGFINQKGVPNALDSKYGKYTWSRPLINFSKPETEEMPPHPGNTDIKPKPPTPAKPFDYSVEPKQNPPKNTPWWVQDVTNLTAAMTDDINKYDPLLTSFENVPYDYNLEDPTRQLAAAESQLKMHLDHAANTVDGNVGLGFGLGASGQAFENAANIIGSVANRNVGTVNNAKNFSAQMTSQINNLNAEARNKFNNETATLNQNYDNAVAARKRVRVSALNKGMENWHKKKWMEQVMFPQVNVDGLTGNVTFSNKNQNMSFETYQNPMMGGMGMNNAAMANINEAYANQYKSSYDQFLKQGLDQETAKKMAEKSASNVFRFAMPNAQQRNFNYFGYGANMAMPWDID